MKEVLIFMGICYLLQQTDPPLWVYAIVLIPTVLLLS